jgi:hypothetical protein
MECTHIVFLHRTGYEAVYWHREACQPPGSGDEGEDSNDVSNQCDE